MKALGAALALALGSVLAGCGQVEAHRVVFSPGQGSGRGGAEVFLATMPDRPFSEIGLVEANGYGTDAEADAVLKALRKEAQKMGCDAVVKVHVDLGNTAAHAVGVCVAYR